MYNEWLCNDEKNRGKNVNCKLFIAHSCHQRKHLSNHCDCMLLQQVSVNMNSFQFHPEKLIEKKMITKQHTIKENVEKNR